MIHSDLVNLFKEETPTIKKVSNAEFWLAYTAWLEVKLLKIANISEEETEAAALEYEKGWGNEEEWLRYYINEDFREGIKWLQNKVKPLTKS